MERKGKYVYCNSLFQNWIYSLGIIYSFFFTKDPDLLILNLVGIICFSTYRVLLRARSVSEKLVFRENNICNHSLSQYPQSSSNFVEHMNDSWRLFLTRQFAKSKMHHHIWVLAVTSLYHLLAQKINMLSINSTIFVIA